MFLLPAGKMPVRGRIENGLLKKAFSVSPPAAAQCGLAFVCWVDHYRLISDGYA
jgi:hypothetical protein